METANDKESAESNPRVDTKSVYSAPAQGVEITGGQLETQNAPVRKRKNKRILIIGLSATLLLILAIAISIFILSKKENNKVPASSTNQPSLKQESSVQSTPTPQTDLPKYKDIDYTDYTSSNVRKYKINYLSGARVLGYCDIKANGQCSPPVPKITYLAASVAGKQTLLFSIVEQSKQLDPMPCEQVAFTVTLNEKSTDVCMSELGGKVVSYSFTFTINGEDQLGMFIMDNEYGQAFYDTSSYASEIKQIIPSIRVYL